MTTIPADAEEFLGTVLGGCWRITRMLGEGGLAMVFEAEGLQGQGRRAIKVLQAPFRGQRSVVERFYAEARVCHSLRHPNIVVVEEFAYASNGSPYMVMERLEGRSLDDHLRRTPVVPPAHVAAWALDVLAALGVAHHAGLVHRDIKPPNLFLSIAADGTTRMKVLDFGVAKVMDAAGGMGSRTRTGAMLGTPGYMSPEQIRDAKSCDARSDLWSLAVVLFELLTRRHPFGDDDHVTRAVAILRDPPHSIQAVAPHLAVWGPLFERTLASDPADRFPSAEAMAEAIRSIGGIPEVPRLEPGEAEPGRSEDSTLSSFLARDAGGDRNDPHRGVHDRGRPHAPPVAFVTAAPFASPSVVWWGVVLIGLGSFAAGLLLGYLLAW